MIRTLRFIGETALMLASASPLAIAYCIACPPTARAATLDCDVPCQQNLLIASGAVIITLLLIILIGEIRNRLHWRRMEQKAAEMRARIEPQAGMPLSEMEVWHD